MTRTAITWDDAIAFFLGYIVEDVSDGTSRAYASDLRHLANASERYLPAEVTPAHLRLYVELLAAEGRADASIARKVSVLRRFFDTLNVAGIVRPDPALGLSFAAPAEAPLLYSEPDLARIIAAAEAGRTPSARRDAVIVHLLAGIGPRVTEVAMLRYWDFEAERGVLTIGYGTATEREAVLPERLVARLDRYLDVTRPALMGRNACAAMFPTRRGARFTRQGIWQAMGQYGASPSVLRNTAAARMLERGDAPTEIARVLSTRAGRIAAIQRELAARRVEERAA